MWEAFAVWFTVRLFEAMLFDLYLVPFLAHYAHNRAGHSLRHLVIPTAECKDCPWPPADDGIRHL
jgi:hypothetical protein